MNPEPRGASSAPGAARTRAAFRAARPGRFDLEVGVSFDEQINLQDDLRESVLACHRRVRDALHAVLEKIVRLRGRDPIACCRRELTGLVADLPLFELMPMIEMNRRSAIVDVRTASGVSRLWCSNGELIDASSGNLHGRPAAYRILALDEGELCVDYRPVSRPRLIRDKMRSIVMEAARRKDECAELTQWLGGPDRTWVPSPWTGTGALNDNEALTLGPLVGERSLRRVLATSRLGDLETLQAMAELARRGYVRPGSPHARAVAAPVPSASEPTWSEPPAPSGTWVKGRRGGVLAAGALTLGLAWVAIRPGAAGETEPAPASASGLSPAHALEGDHGHGSAYRVRVSVDPSDSVLWLDGRRVATGHLALNLNRDGRTHELFIEASDRQSKTYLFQDVPPPRIVVLEAPREPEQAMRATARPASE